jgi:hypothetical protein
MPNVRFTQFSEVVPGLVPRMRFWVALMRCPASARCGEVS